MYGWKIDRDYLNVSDEDKARYGCVGKGRKTSDFREGVAPRQRWRLMDDDEIVCFGGWLEDDGKSDYDAWQSVADFGETWACTQVQERDPATNEWTGVIG